MSNNPIKLSEHQHLQKAKSNIKFLDFLNGCDFHDWIVTTDYYTALHFLCAFLRKHGCTEPFISHDRRREICDEWIYVKNHGHKQLGSILGKLDRLEAKSRYARYDSDSCLKHKIGTGDLRKIRKIATEDIPKQLGFRTT